MIIKNKDGTKSFRLSMANCFDFRSRASTFDLHDIGNASKMSLLAKIFRSKSEGSVKSSKSSKSSTSSSKSSSKSSPGAAPRRRFARVVRDSEAEGAEYSNPHVVRRYNKGYWENQQQNAMRKSHSLEETNKPLPYTVSGHTILKKHRSVDDHDIPSTNHELTALSPTGGADGAKHAKFKEEVEVVEYDIKGKCLLIMNDRSNIHTEKLADECYLDFDFVNEQLDPIEEHHDENQEDDDEVFLSQVEVHDDKDMQETQQMFEKSASFQDSDSSSCDGAPSTASESVYTDTDFEKEKSDVDEPTNTSCDAGDNKCEPQKSESEEKENCDPTQIEDKRTIFQGQVSLEENGSAPKKSKFESSNKITKESTLEVSSTP